MDHHSLPLSSDVDTYPRFHDAPIQRFPDPSSSTTEFSMQVSQPHAPPTQNSSGFFQGASNVSANHGVFNHVAGGQLNIYENSINVEMMDNACLNNLPRAMAAGHSSESHRTCLRGTREAVLREIETWEVDKINEFVYWLKGVAGCGKSTIAQTFAECSAANGRLGASFFCSRDFPDRRNLRLIFPTLAYDLAYRFPAFKSALVPIIRSNPGVEHDALAIQLEKLLVRPLKQTGLSFTIVVDALDECEDKEPVSAFLSALARYIEEIPSVKFFITGRPEDHIRSGFMIPSLRTKELPLHDVDSATVDMDIKSFIETKLSEIATRRRLCIDGSWPSNNEIAAILKKCSGLFIIASIIVRFIDYPYATPKDRLKMIMDMPNSTVFEGKAGIDVMYNQILAACLQNVDPDDSGFFDQLRLVVGSIVLAFKPLSRAGFAKILQISSERIWNILSRLHSVIIVPESAMEPIRICHKSFADFITEQQRCADSSYFINAPAHHLALGALCLELMDTTLTKNICSLPRYAMNYEIKDLPARREKYIGTSLAYACLSWAKHLRSSLGTGDDTSYIVELVNYLLEDRFLSWLEVLSIEGAFHLAIHSFHDVRSWLTDVNSQATSVLELIDDYERFVLRFFDVMENSATHIYHSALPWSPASSSIRRFYQNGLITEVKLLNALDTTWDACIRVFPVDDIVDAVFFSDKGALIGVRGGHYVKVFDTMTGVIRNAFNAHARIYSATFSADEDLLAYGLEDGTVCVWDLQTGNPVRTFGGRAGKVYCVVFSPCGTTIASCMENNTIRIWNTSSGCCECILEDRSRRGKGVCWSATGNHVISSDDTTIQVWDLSKQTCSMIHQGHIAQTSVVATTPGSFLVASGSSNGTIKVYDSRSGDVTHTLSTNNSLQSMQFSIDGDKIMYTTRNAGYIWDLATEAHVSTTECDGDCATFSPGGTSVASVSGNLLKIWKTEKGYKPLQASTYHRSDKLTDVTLSPDGQLISSRSDDGFHVTTNVWDSTIGECLFTFDDTAGVDSIAFSPDSVFIACFLKHIIGDNCRFVQIWNVYTRSLVNSIQVDNDAYRIAMSPDNRRLFSLSSSRIKLSDLASERCLACLDFGVSLFHVPYAAFAADGTSVFFDNIYGLRRGWQISPASLSHDAFDSLPMVFVLMYEKRLDQDESVLSKPYRYKRGDEWIMDQYGRRMLWVPPDERAWSSDNHGKKVVVGTVRGKVYIVDFSAVLLF